MLAVTTLALLAVLVSSLYLFLKRRFTYWQDRGVPGPKPNFPFGNFAAVTLGRTSIGEAYENVYQRYKHERYVGAYFWHTPVLQINDREILKQVMIKEFQDFNTRSMYSDPHRDPLSGNLLFLSGTAWRNMRVKMSPAFTSGKIKSMFDRITECAESMHQHVESRVDAQGGSYREDVKDLLARLTTDIISSVAFGIESNSMKKQDSAFRRIGKKIFEPSFSQGGRGMLTFFVPGIMSTFNISIMPAEVNEFMKRTVRETVEYREKHGVERADMLNLLMQLKNKGFIAPEAVGEPTSETKAEEVIKKLTMNEITAQVFFFFAAGFETSSSASFLALYEMAKNLTVQAKVHEEIDRVLEKHKGVVTYEAVMEVPYLEQVINETMRLYPALPFITRGAVRTRKLPLTDLIVEKDTRIIIPVRALHGDPELWPNPEEFDPDRFSEENKGSIPQMAYLPFGEGPRICIGLRLGLVQVKVALMTLLSRFSVSLCPDTPLKLTIHPKSIVTQPLEEVHLSIARRQGQPSQTDGVR